MTEETDQDAPAGEIAPAGSAPAGDDAPVPGEPAAAGAAGRPARTPRRRAPKQDALLMADVGTARAGVEQIADPSQIGPGHRVVVEEDRLVVHLFECTLPGYRGWNWFASLARAPRSRTVTVCEVGLLPGEEALLAPEWVPWAERVSPEERAQEEAEDTAPEGPVTAGDAPADLAAEAADGTERAPADAGGTGAEGTGRTTAGDSTPDTADAATPAPQDGERS